MNIWIVKNKKDPVTIPVDFSPKDSKLILKLIRKYGMPRRAKLILKKNNKSEGFTLPDIKTHYKAIVIKTVWY